MRVRLLTDPCRLASYEVSVAEAPVVDRLALGGFVYSCEVVMAELVDMVNDMAASVSR